MSASPDPVVALLSRHLEGISSVLATVTGQRDRAEQDAAAARADAHSQADLNVELLDKLAAVRRYADECKAREGAQLDALTVAATLRGLVGEGK